MKWNKYNWQAKSSKGKPNFLSHMGVMASQSTGKLTVYSTTDFSAQHSALLVFCEENPPVISGFPHKVSVMQKAFLCDDVFMQFCRISVWSIPMAGASNVPYLLGPFLWHERLYEYEMWATANQGGGY